MTLGNLTALFPLALVVAMLAANLVAQQSPSFIARTEGVRLHVAVERGGRPVTGLSADQFIVLDDGVPQSVTTASVVDGLSLSFVIDQSESTAVGPFNELRTTVLSVLDVLAPDDTAALLLFDDRLNARVPPTRDRAAIRKAIESATSQPRTLTALWDATVAGVSLLERESGRPVVMVATDGCDTASWLSPSQAIEWLSRSDVTIDYFWYVASTPQRDLGNWRSGDLCLGPFSLDKTAEATGGQILRTERKDLAQRIRERVVELRSGYLLTFTPIGVSKEGWHKLEVRLRNGSRGRVTARPGYFAGPGTSKR